MVKMRRKVCRGLRGIGSVGPMWLVNGQIVTGNRLQTLSFCVSDGV